MGLSGAATSLGPAKFRMTQANKDYGICATYPRLLVVPAATSDDDLRKVAVFRSKGRLPAVVYRSALPPTIPMIAHDDRCVCTSYACGCSHCPPQAPQ